MKIVASAKSYLIVVGNVVSIIDIMGQRMRIFFFHNVHNLTMLPVYSNVKWSRFIFNK